MTDEVTVMPPLLDTSATTNPPVGAWPFNVTVPVVAVPPVTVAGESELPVRTEAVSVSVAVKVLPP